MEKRRPIYRLYLDDSGTRNPSFDKRTNANDKWFGLGGFLIKDVDVEAVKDRHAAFCASWSISYPLHSAEIRHRTGNFSWLANLKQVEERQFFRDISALMTQSPILGHACVINKAGYDLKYNALYGSEKWFLCKTAFSVVLERAAKFADAQGHRLKTFVKYSDPTSDRRMKDYYREIKRDGLPFSRDGSSKYAPLSQQMLDYILLDMQFRDKASSLMQLADIMLYPICRGGFDDFYRPLVALQQSGRLIDNQLRSTEIDVLGIKYSCFDAWKTKRAAP